MFDCTSIYRAQFSTYEDKIWTQYVFLNCLDVLFSIFKIFIFRSFYDNFRKFQGNFFQNSDRGKILRQHSSNWTQKNLFWFFSKHYFFQGQNFYFWKFQGHLCPGVCNLSVACLLYFVYLITIFRFLVKDEYNSAKYWNGTDLCENCLFTS